MKHNLLKEGDFCAKTIYELKVSGNSDLKYLAEFPLPKFQIVNSFDGRD